MQKINSKMAELRASLSVITLNENGLIPSIKVQRLKEWEKM